MQNAGLIREVRGVMTRFEPLTEEIVAACTQDGLTYDQLLHCLLKGWQDTLVGLAVPDEKTGSFVFHVAPSK